MSTRTSPAVSSTFNAAFVLSFVTLLAAWGFQYIGGFEPCALCYAQRNPYYIGIPLLAIGNIFWGRMSSNLKIAITTIGAAIFIWSTYQAVFHAGVEWQFWEGPASCTGATTFSFDDLTNLDDTTIVRCDVPSFRLFGLSFAGYNALISLLIASLCAFAAWDQFQKRNKKEI